jgi:hypothetical protein
MNLEKLCILHDALAECPMRTWKNGTSDAFAAVQAQAQNLPWENPVPSEACPGGWAIAEHVEDGTSLFSDWQDYEGSYGARRKVQSDMVELGKLG